MPTLNFEDALTAYKGEAFYGDMLKVAFYLSDLDRKSFRMHYKVTNERSEKVIALLKSVIFSFIRA